MAANPQDSPGANPSGRIIAHESIVFDSDLSTPPLDAADRPAGTPLRSSVEIASERAADDGRPAAARAAQDRFEAGVVTDIIRWQAYVQRQLRRHRGTRVVVIAAAGVVPVLASIDGVAKIWLGVFGAIAAVAEALSQLYRWRDSGVALMRSANALDHLHNLYATMSAPYDGPRPFQRYIADVENVRTAASAAFAGIWAEDKPPAGSAPPPGT
jgi:hypothetical protein